MIESDIVRHCSATLAGIKTGNTFTVALGSREELRDSVRRVNAMLLDKGIRVVIAKYFEKRALLYMFRPDRLKEDLCDPEACSILKRRGYPCGNADKCVLTLIRNLRQYSEYPHEIGLFIGYPPEDVRCFMQDGGKGVKCSGCWKAYGDAERASRLFSRIRSCREKYERAFAEGRSLRDLAAAQS